jgi:anti-sigma-K factor RskA
MSHDEASDLLGAYALDAVDGDEFAELEEHLDTCPRCRAELDSLRDVAAAMGNSVEPLPEGLWSQIASRLPERQEGEEPPPMPQLTPERAAGSPFRTPSSGRPRRRSVSTLIGAIAVAAAAVAVVLGIGLVRADNNVSNLQAAGPTSLTAALHTPGHRLITLHTSSHAERAQVVVTPSGQGFLVSSNLPTLGHGQTYQLWGIVGHNPISLGLLGNSPRAAAFTIAGSTRPTVLGVTAEPAGGSIVPTGAMVATGTV